MPELPTLFKCKQNYVDRVYGVQTHPAMGFTVLEKVFKKDEAYRKQREIFYIQKMEAQYKGINRDKGG